METEKPLHESMRRLLAAVRDATDIADFDFPNIAAALKVSSARMTNWKKRGISAEGAVAAEQKWGCSPSWMRSLSSAELRELSEDQLLAFLHGEGHSGGITLPMQNAILAELIRRGSKPHWSLAWSFWVIIVSVLLSTAAVYFAYLAVPTKPVGPQAPGSAPSSAGSPRQ